MRGALPTHFRWVGIDYYFFVGGRGGAWRKVTLMPLRRYNRQGSFPSIYRLIRLYVPLLFLVSRFEYQVFKKKSLVDGKHIKINGWYMRAITN